MRLVVRIAAALTLACVAARVCAVQALPAPPASPPGPAASLRPAKSATRFAGVVQEIDAAALKLTDASGKTVEIGIDSRSRFYRDRAAAGWSSFKAGDRGVAHVRPSRKAGSLKLAYLADPGTEEWMRAARRRIFSGVVKRLDAASLCVVAGADQTVYELDGRTRWLKGGKEGAPGLFKAGEAVTVVPGGRVNGALFARIVADTPAGARKEKESIARTVHGRISTVDPAAHRIVVAMRDGQTRTVIVAPDTEILMQAAPASFSDLKPGEHVDVLLRSGPPNDHARRIRLSYPRKRVRGGSVTKPPAVAR
jgi:hypothetical protein